MRGLSTKPKNIIPFLSVYDGVTVNFTNDMKDVGVARFFSPKPGLEQEGKPYVTIYNGDSQKIYQIYEEYDHGATQCIMELIREEFVVPKGEESLFYIIFVLLHEAGHWYDYLNNHDWYNQNFTDEKCNTPEEYRNKPCEKSADKFALEHFENAWDELNESLFNGLLEPLEKTY